MSLFAVILVICLLAICYSYIGYPCFWLLSKTERLNYSDEKENGDDLPSVTIIIAAFNEVTCIAARVRNLLALDYPSNKLRIRIESDGSDDATVVQAREAAQGDSRVHISDHKERRGKVCLLNEACQGVESDILAFSDANVEFAPDALKRLVLPFFHKDIACVCGKLLFRATEGSAHVASEGIYWRLESWLKEKEGSCGILLGANGANYAIRRSLWMACPSDTLVEDFYIPMTLLMQGHKVVFEPRSLAYETLPPTLGDEFGRRIRIGAGDFQALARCFPLLHPRFGLAAWAFFSRKVLRWFGPFFLLGSLISSMVLTIQGIWLGYLVLIGWTLFLASAILGTAARTRHGILGKLFAAAAHFASMNLALFFGFFRWLSRSQQVTWKRTAR